MPNEEVIRAVFFRLNAMSDPGPSPGLATSVSEHQSETSSKISTSCRTKTTIPTTSSRTPAVRRRRKQAWEMDAFDSALLQRLAEVREETHDGWNISSSFGNYITMLLKELPLDETKRLMKEPVQHYEHTCTHTER